MKDDDDDIAKPFFKHNSLKSYNKNNNTA
jgi:hypothetical protein